MHCQPVLYGNRQCVLLHQSQYPQITLEDCPANIGHRKKILSNPITRAYNRAYKTHNARIRYGTMTRAEFQTWVAKAKQLRDACQSGEISLDRFEKWLKQ